MKAVADRILVIEDEAPSVSAGGLFLAPSAREEQSRGEVISVGPRVLEIKEGDRVLFTKYEGTEIDVKGPAGETYVSLTEAEVTAVISP